MLNSISKQKCQNCENVLCRGGGGGYEKLILHTNNYGYLNITEQTFVQINNVTWKLLLSKRKSCVFNITFVKHMK